MPILRPAVTTYHFLGRRYAGEPAGWKLEGGDDAEVDGGDVEDDGGGVGRWLADPLVDEDGTGADACVSRPRPR